MSVGELPSYNYYLYYQPVRRLWRPVLAGQENSMKRLKQSLLHARVWTEIRGQDLVEYALLAGFIAVAVAATFPPLTVPISTIFSRMTSLLDRA